MCNVTYTTCNDGALEAFPPAVVLLACGRITLLYLLWKLGLAMELAMESWWTGQVTSVWKLQKLVHNSSAIVITEVRIHRGIELPST